MKMLKRIGFIFFTLVILAFSTLPVFAKGNAEKPYIAVVSKGEQHDFWQQVKLGANEAAAALSVEITFEGPASESDVQDQVAMLNNAMAKKPVAICLAALDTNAVMDQLQQCLDKGIPVIGFDSGVPQAPAGSIYATASTDNYAAAGLAAEKMFAVIKDKVMAATSAAPVAIVALNQDAASESILSRGKGFRDRMIELIKGAGIAESDIAVMGNPAYVDGPTSGDVVVIYMYVPASTANVDTTNAATAVLNRVKSDNVVGIYCSNENTAKGVLSATDDGAQLPVKYAGLTVIGFDAGANQKNAVRKGYFLGSITQDPYSIGYKAVSLAVKAYKGESVSDVDTGAKFYDKNNMDDADITGLLYD